MLVTEMDGSQFYKQICRSKVDHPADHSGIPDQKQPQATFAQIQGFCPGSLYCIDAYHILPNDAYFATFSIL